MSGLETLPPDQRAVLQLILVQGRGYADLAQLLKLDVEAVRSRAHAGLDALAGRAGSGHALDAAQRARVADYLLGQQDDGERIVTFAELGDSESACRWAQALRERLAGIAQTELPEVPASASANGSASSRPTAMAAPPPPARGGTATGVAGLPAPEPTPSSLPDRPSTTTASAGPRPSRLGGAALLAGVVVLLVVLAIVLIDGGDEGDSAGSTTSAQTQTTARTQTSTTPTAATPRLVGQVNLTPPASGDAIGIGLVQRTGRRLTIAIEARRLPANGAQDIYAVWLQGATGSRFLGFVPRQVRAGGSFTVSAALPANVRDFSTLLISREGLTAVPQAPGETILSGALRLRS